MESGQNMARTKGAVALTETERRVVQIMSQQGATVRRIAAELNRSPKTIYKLLADIRANPPAQSVVPLGLTHGEA